jgi:excisionase family DNA binding protein
LEDQQYLDELLSANEAGKLLGVSGKTVIRMMENKDFDGYKIGSYWKFRRGDVLQYRISRKYKGEKIEDTEETSDEAA